MEGTKGSSNDVKVWETEKLEDAVESPGAKEIPGAGEERHPTVTGQGSSEASETDFNRTYSSEQQTGYQEEISVLKQINAVQRDHLERLQKELNEAHVKKSEEVYWIRLELDSSRLEKEAVEDRLAELYRDVQDMVERKSSMKSPEGDGATDVCTEADYVLGLESRIEAFERTVDLITRQMAMLKSSSEAVVSSLRQEVSDLMEEKSRMEMDLLNQISILDNDKRELEVKNKALSESRQEDGKELMSPAVQSLSSSASVIHNEATPEKALPSKEHLVKGSAPNADSGRHQEVSFRSTATTQGSSFTHENVSSQYPTCFLGSNDSCWPHLDDQGNSELKNQHDQQEAFKMKTELDALRMDNAGLRQKVDEITKELLFTRSSANTALTIDKVRSDREETLAYLDRVSFLWDRADKTIQVLEALLSEVQPSPVEQLEVQASPTERAINLGSGDGVREGILSTLEIATILHGQVKLSLMQIELGFRNNMSSVQNDNAVNQDAIIEKVRNFRHETLAAISEAEAKFSAQTDELKEQIKSEESSLKDRLQSQLYQLEKTQASHKVLESEVVKLKQQLAERHEPETTTGDAESAPETAYEASRTNGLVVSHNVMARLQKEVISVVEQVQKKNEIISRLTSAIEKHKIREEVLQKELKRAQVKHGSISKVHGTVASRPKLELPGGPTESEIGFPAFLGSQHNRKNAKKKQTKLDARAGKENPHPKKKHTLVKGTATTRNETFSGAVDWT